MSPTRQWSDSRSSDGRQFRVTKDDLKKAEEAVEKVVDEAIGPPPAVDRQSAEDED